MEVGSGSATQFAAYLHVYATSKTLRAGRKQGREHVVLSVALSYPPGPGRIIHPVAKPFRSY
jgi:hypothetical protein